MGILADWQIERDVGIEPFQKAAKRPGEISSGLSGYGYDCRLGYKFKVFKPYPATVIDPKAFDPRMLEDVDLSLNHPQYKTREEWQEAYMAGYVYDGPPPDHLVIPPHSFVLGESLERFKIPRDVLCVVVGKSTYARCGLIVNVTPGEPEWEGYWTIELSNTTPLPMKVYPGEGIMQCLFFRSDGWREWLWAKVTQLWTHVFRTIDGLVPPGANLSTFTSCRQSYADKKGKYANQTGLTLPKAD